MAAHEQMEAGRVPSPYFEAVERAQRDLHGCEGFDRASSAGSVEKVADGLRGAEPIPRNGPAGISHSREHGVDPFELVGNCTGVQLRVDGCDRERDVVRVAADRGAQLG
jgi:hypothetical protein